MTKLVLKPETPRSGPRKEKTALGLSFAIARLKIELKEKVQKVDIEIHKVAETREFFFMFEFSVSQKRKNMFPEFFFRDFSITEPIGM